MARAAHAFSAPLSGREATQAALAAQLRDGLRQAFPLPEGDSEERFRGLLDALAQRGRPTARQDPP